MKRTFPVATTPALAALVLASLPGVSSAGVTFNAGGNAANGRGLGLSTFVQCAKYHF